MTQTPVGKVITSIEALQRERESFDALFKPKTVAVIGLSLIHISEPTRH